MGLCSPAVPLGYLSGALLKLLKYNTRLEQTDVILNIIMDNLVSGQHGPGLISLKATSKGNGQVQ